MRFIEAAVLQIELEEERVGCGFAALPIPTVGLEKLSSSVSVKSYGASAHVESS